MTTSRQSATGSDHARHDLLRVAEAADRAGTLPPDLADCPDCRALYADLVAIATALPAAAIPTRPRDYRLTPADATRLRRSGWRRWFAVIGSPRDTITRPLALGLTTLGLAGLLFTSLPSLQLGSGAASAPAYSTEQGAPADSANAAGAGEAAASGPAAAAPSAGDESAISKALGDASAAPSEAPVAPLAGTTGREPAPSAGVDTGAEPAVIPERESTAQVAPAPSAGQATGADTTADSAMAGPSSGPSTAPVTVAFGLFLAGLALFGLRLVARRSAER